MVLVHRMHHWLLIDAAFFASMMAAGIAPNLHPSQALVSSLKEAPATGSSRRRIVRKCSPTYGHGQGVRAGQSMGGLMLNKKRLGFIVPSKIRV